MVWGVGTTDKKLVGRTVRECYYSSKMSENFLCTYTSTQWGSDSTHWYKEQNYKTYVQIDTWTRTFVAALFRIVQN